ncbi:DUF1501 domain-containing protein [Pandoraea nosoerga]|uniref:Twin-arginine translocation pathway signal sequence domain-containing protein n=1 Tax=Pandoraea nosoerga TaxID=2508296 RepID=A0A5E4SBK1_9BURK|nr:DUF1501 domain-containing protein [Pandoraea nosoerga]MBN4666957.1 DUF1501 domain-containing protein [Pandoraea nosoerga]MBN4674828.1 DUF1501 domain-containing protein [Pandoraea nosoerga]MBN4681807.1 DUF1501 domain-containing protein [Pandoraea nosoerga]MBN4744123.1 DUF1501 domain-containing protein [Pandoraea nosoerga]VVD72521.1 Twin-arginine translocation pathway signal sequence domain-containing protein [Pandoraea nosoerga]
MRDFRRRDFLTFAAGLGAAWLAPLPAFAAARDLSRPLAGAQAPHGGSYDNLLILIELKGGNDGLNTVIPYGDPLYAALRPNIGIKREQVIQLDERSGLHPELRALMPMWQANELAIVQGVGYPQPNLSHFRSIEIWNTASRADEYLRDGWLSRAFAERAVPSGFDADGVIVGSAEPGPLAGGARAVTLTNPAQFLRDAGLASANAAQASNPALAHVLRVENDIVKAAHGLRPRQGQYVLKTPMPPGAFGNVVKTALQVLAAADSPAGVPLPGRGVAVLRLTLNGFDTHQNQPGQQASLLRQLAQGMMALRAGLTALGRWQSTMIVTYAEFGRRPRENQSNGTDHGTVAPHFIAGGGVRGGLYGEAPRLDRLDGNGNLPFAVDFREVYATVLQRWWGMDPRPVLGAPFQPLDVLRG